MLTEAHQGSALGRPRRLSLRRARARDPSSEGGIDAMGRLACPPPAHHCPQPRGWAMDQPSRGWEGGGGHGRGAWGAARAEATPIQKTRRFAPTRPFRLSVSAPPREGMPPPPRTRTAHRPHAYTSFKTSQGSGMGMGGGGGGGGGGPPTCSPPRPRSRHTFGIFFPGLGVVTFRAPVRAPSLSRRLIPSHALFGVVCLSRAGPGCPARPPPSRRRVGSPRPCLLPVPPLPPSPSPSLAALLPSPACLCACEMRDRRSAHPGTGRD